MQKTHHIRAAETPERLLFPILPAQKTSVFQRNLIHRSIIQYQVEKDRIRKLIPAEFDLPEIPILSVESFLDRDRICYEQTNYRVQVEFNGQLCHWLLGSSLGSLSAVTSRHMYALPWHLSAMEFHVAFDALNRKYHAYRIRTQSQWANSMWEIVDTGIPCRSEKSLTITDYFIRRDSEIGSYQTIYQPSFATHGELKKAGCDWLQSLGILNAAEIKSPIFVSLQQAVSSEIKPALVPSRVLLAA